MCRNIKINISGGNGTWYGPQRATDYTSKSFGNRQYDPSMFNKDGQCRFCACPTCNHWKDCKPCGNKIGGVSCFKPVYCGIFETSRDFYETKL